MLPRTRRAGKKAFPLPKGITQSRSGEYLSLRVVATGDRANPSRFSVVTSSKIAKQAVTRNTIRRRVYSAIREIPNISTGLICVFYAKKEILKAPYRAVSQEVFSLISSLKAGS